MTIEEIADRWGLTPEGVDYALEQYVKVMCDITHGMLSKLTYDAEFVLQTAQERWCDTCELKEAQEPVKPETYLVMGTFKFYRCPECKMSWYTKGNYCLNCGRAVKWDD